MTTSPSITSFRAARAARPPGKMSSRPARRAIWRLCLPRPPGMHGIIHLLVEPDILHAPAVEGAVDHDRQALDIGALAGAAAAVENDRPHIVVGQLALDRP